MLTADLLIAVNLDPDSRRRTCCACPSAAGWRPAPRGPGHAPRPSTLPGRHSRSGLRSRRSWSGCRCARCPPGAAIDLVLDRARENGSQLVFTTAAAWMRRSGSRRAPASRPAKRHPPTAGAAGMAQLAILVDTGAVRVPLLNSAGGDGSAAMPAATIASRRWTADRRGGTQVAARPDVELINRTLRDLLGELRRAAPRRGCGRGPLLADFKLDRIRPAVVADGLAELQARWPGVPIVFCEPASWPRNGPTATWQLCTRGPPPSTPSPTTSARNWPQRKL